MVRRWNTPASKNRSSSRIALGSFRRIQTASVRTGQQVGAGRLSLRSASEHSSCLESDSRRIAMRGPVSTRALSVLTEPFHVLRMGTHIGRPTLDATDETSATCCLVAGLFVLLLDSCVRAVLFTVNEGLVDKVPEKLTGVLPALARKRLEFLLVFGVKFH